VTLHRFFLHGPLPESGAAGTELAMGATDRHHLARVLRLEVGDRIVIAGQDGREAEATLRAVSADRVTADIGAAIERPRRPRIVLAAGIARRERMEFTIQKTTELGVGEIWPLASARCVVRFDEDRAGRRAERWRRIAEEAAKQSQRADVPLVRDAISLDDLLVEAGRFDVVLVPWEEAASTAVGIGQALEAQNASADSTVLVVVGPEGGFETAEVSALQDAGARIVSLGDTVLRTETAAVVAVALTAYELGGLGGRAR
jgi:16S rRNA (uracil1498-N3)-methyltransferase